MYTLVWQKRKTNRKAFEKVKRKVMELEVSQGGLNMININKMQESFYLQWLGTLFTSRDENWTYIPKWYFEAVGSVMSALDMNCKSKTLKDKHYIKSPFWQAVLHSHLDSKPLLEKEDINENNFRMQLLWNNINVQYKGNVLFFPAWKNAGIERFNDIINVDEKRLLNINEVVNKIRKNHANIVFQYNAITNAIPSSWKQWVSVVGHSEMQQQYLFDLRKYCAKPKMIMKMLWQIDRNSEHVKSCAQGFWLRKLNVEIDKSIWLIPHLATKETRLRELQWKIINNLYPTNILLHKIKITSDNKCSLCRDGTDYK
jgi:hypothetical protein